MHEQKRITIFLGHYGSGKTNLAVNYAVHAAKSGKKVLLGDFDIVNPYFRAKDSAKELSELSVELISSPYANSNLDIPALPASMYRIVNERDKLAVIDVGGDDAGAVALGRLRQQILMQNSFEAVFVANFYRPLTKTPEQALEVMREIEAACQIPVTAVVNNSNLGRLTTAADVEKTDSAAKKLCELCGLPLLFTSAERSVAGELRLDGKVFAMQLQKRYFDIPL